MNESLDYLSPRLIRCLAYLSEREDYMTVNDLAEFLKTSKRTLFREMKDINSILRLYGLEMQTKTGHGVRLEGSSEDRNQFKRLLLQTSLRQSNFSKDDRQTVLLAELLKNKQLEKLMVYANQFQVSEATISNDINALEPILAQYHLKLTRRPGASLALEGNEEDIRKTILDFIYKHMEEDKFSMLLNMQAPWDIETYFKNQGPDSILQVLNKNILWQVITILKENDLFWIHRLAQNAYVGLILHLTIAIERMLNKEKIHMDPKLLDQLKCDSMFERAKDLAEYFEDEFDIVFPIEEIAYISMHLKGARLLHIAPQEDNDMVSEFSMLEIHQMITQLISEFESVSGVSLAQDELLVSGLLTHLRPALTRVRYHLEIRNPLLKQIQTQYQQVYKLAETSVQRMSVPEIAQLNDDEIGYIALHFGAALERLNQRNNFNRLKVAVLCASGIGISSLLASRIKRIFKDSLQVQPRSHLELKQIELEGFDLILSTMDIESTPIPVLQVNPLLNDEDIAAIQAQIQRLNDIARMRNTEEDTNLSWRDQLNLVATLTGCVTKLLNELDVLVIDREMDISQLLKYISQSLGSNENAVHLIEEDLKRREEMGSLILSDERIAIFHAKSSAVRSPKMRVYRCRSGTFSAFGDRTVATVIVFLVPMSAPTELNRWLSHLTAGLIEDSAYLETIQGQDKEAIRKEVSRLLEEPIREWIRQKV